MQNPVLKISLSALSIMLAMMVYTAVTSAQNGETASDPDPVLCNLWVENKYAKADQPLEEAMDLYHETVNEKFNYYTKLMIQGQTAASKAGKSDPNSRAPEDGICDEKNYSTYCVAKVLLTDQLGGDPFSEGGSEEIPAGSGYSYMEYLKALECRKNRIFDTVTEETLWSEYQEGMIIGEENEAEALARLQSQRALTVSARMEAIEREIDDAKRALDVTLATYDELKTAWVMHLRYVEIYKNLVKFRDKMVEVRHQVEDFPNKFIDATTTMCT